MTFSLLTSLRNLIASSNEEDGAERNKGSGCDTNWRSTTREVCQRFLEKVFSLESLIQNLGLCLTYYRSARLGWAEKLV